MIDGPGSAAYPANSQLITCSLICFEVGALEEVIGS